MISEKDSYKNVPCGDEKTEMPQKVISKWDRYKPNDDGDEPQHYGRSNPPKQNVDNQEFTFKSSSRHIENESDFLSQATPPMQPYRQTPAQDRSRLNRQFVKYNASSQKSHGFEPSIQQQQQHVANDQTIDSRQESTSFSRVKSASSNFRAPGTVMRSLGSCDSPDIGSPVTFSDGREVAWIEDYREQKEASMSPAVSEFRTSMSEFRTPVMGGVSAADHSKGEVRYNFPFSCENLLGCCFYLIVLLDKNLIIVRPQGITFPFATA
jgi:hypothetical protein